MGGDGSRHFPTGWKSNTVGLVDVVIGAVSAAGTTTPTERHCTAVPVVETGSITTSPGRRVGFPPEIGQKSAQRRNRPLKLK
ncbi:hypothetical protein NDU88_006612 [Pleurodeles waltl]|uniref:Uncharacterized protein n=1 Tax=Pleurodeles waltl TaxID=8319 RepID=A0AAV7TXA0_PLEWA|nr:hypothetical protein NDU88_006612 [Pleurodeles waltl]